MTLRFPHIETGLEYNASCTDIWALLTDTTKWAKWGPSVQEVVCSDRFIRLGSKGRVRTRLGIWAPFVITQWDPGRHWSWKVFGIPATGHWVNPTGRKRCRLVFTVPIVAAPYLLVCRLALRRISRILRE